MRLRPISTPSCKGRVLDDNANILLRFKGGARGMLWASQVAPGNENGLKLRVYGTKGGLEWVQDDPNYLWYTPFGQPKQLITRAGAGAGAAAARVIPRPGRPSGRLSRRLRQHLCRKRPAPSAPRGAKAAKPPRGCDLPDRADGVEGVAFVEACVRSSRKNAAWVPLSL